MAAKYLFKGIDRVTGKEVTGSYVYLYNQGFDWTGMRRGKKTETHFIFEESDYPHAVEPETVEQIR